MDKLKLFSIAAVLGVFLIGSVSNANPAPSANAQVSVGVDIGPAPDCPYGYYDYAPYACAPYGYYGPEWFADGVFVGAGPWFHGPNEFRGHVDNHFDVHHGYKGHVPDRGEKAAPENHVDKMPNFHGNEMRDGRGHTVPEKR